MCVELKEENNVTLLSKNNCRGFYQKGPIVNIFPAGIFCDNVKEILEKNIKNDSFIDRLSYIVITGEYVRNRMETISL
jgi:hypothetical protein